MASSAFKSTTRRAIHASDDRPARKPAQPARHSRSVSAASRRGSGGGGGGGSELDGYANTHTNPLFDCESSPKTPPGPAPASGDGSGHVVKGGGGGGGGPRRASRARSASVAPPHRRSTSATSSEIGGGGGGGRRVSRARSMAGEVQPYLGSETDVGNRDAVRNLYSWRSRHPVPSSLEASTSGKHCEDGAFASSSPERSTTKMGHLEINGNIQSESSSAVSEMGIDLEHAIWGKNHSTIPVEQVLKIPPEFDPDATEFVSDISEYATILKQEQVLEIPLEFDPDAAGLVSDIRQHATKLQLEQMEISLEFDPDTAELVSDITEYTTKLKQSHERARKLRADLAVEEQREQELSRMLKDIVAIPNFTETHKKRPRRKRSIERLKVSRRLAEEAMNYFEECVSISTLDSTDFSSLEDPQLNSAVSIQPISSSRFHCKRESTFSEPHLPIDRLGHHEESDNHTQCSISISGSDVSDSVIFGGIKASDLIIGNNSSDDFDGFKTPGSESSRFSFTHEPARTPEIHDVGRYLRSFEKGISNEPREMRPSYCADDYVLENLNEKLLTDMVTFKNRIESGGLLICDIRTF